MYAPSKKRNYTSAFGEGGEGSQGAMKMKQIKKSKRRAENPRARKRSRVEEIPECRIEAGETRPEQPSKTTAPGTKSITARKNSLRVEL